MACPVVGPSSDWDTSHYGLYTVTCQPVESGPTFPHGSGPNTRCRKPQPFTVASLEFIPPREAALDPR